MNIGSVKTDVVSQPPAAITPKPAAAASTPITGADSFTPAQNENLVNMLQQQPDVRPEAVERARQLAADPNYPGADLISRLANLVISDSQ